MHFKILRYMYIYIYIYIYIIIIIIVRTPPFPFFKGGKVNFDYLPPRGKIQKRGGTMVQAQVFLLKRGRGWHFSYFIFSRLIIFTFRNFFTLFKILSYIWRKIIFSATIILWRKVILRCLKMNLKICYKLK